MASSWYNKVMPNKTRFIIDPTKEYVVKLDNGEETMITGLTIVNLAKSIDTHKKAIEKINKIKFERLINE